MPSKLKVPARARIIIIAAVAIVIGIAALALVLHSALSGANAPPASVPTPHYVQHISAALASQDVLSFNNSQYIVPYALVGYTSNNASALTFNATVYRSQPPTKIYLLNISDQCFNCGNTTAIEDAISKDLISYNLISGQGNLSFISVSNIGSISHNSILIILNGLLPQGLLNRVNGTNSTGVQLLLNRGTSIIYAGQDFSHTLLPGSIVVPTATQLPSYLSTIPIPSNAIGLSSNFYFNRPTFVFVNGSRFGPTSYINALNGSFVAFPNAPNSWASASQAGRDIAKAVEQLFWLPSYSTGSGSIYVPFFNSTGETGILMQATALRYSYVNISQINNGYGRIVVTANYTLNQPAGAFQYVYYKPSAGLNGTVSVQPSVIANSSIPLTFTIATKSAAPVSLEPHLDIYNINMTKVTSIPLPFTSASGNFTFLKYLNFYVGPGSYIASLKGFSNQEYGASYFTVPPINFTLANANYSSGSFLFFVTSMRQPLNGISYKISINNQYQALGTIYNGTLSYTLPKGTPTIFGNITFTISMLSQNFYFPASNAAPVIKINSEYIEVAIVAAIIIMMVLLVKAPNRDEFYIDVPSLPEQKKIPIRMKANELIGVFDKLNMYYHWKYMPLSKAEIKSAIANNIRVNNMPVSLTYNNIELMLNELAFNGMLVSADDLYAPKEWVQQSGHDIEYLATFKKLRIFLVTHAYVFTDIDASTTSDIVATLHGERKYVVIYSKTSKFMKLPTFADAKTYLVFLNSYKLDQFKQNLFGSMSKEAEELKMYISVGSVRLVDADDPKDLID
ncbi:MAG: hypothetical protein KGH60_00230 [Candidatus Micrarchaeota archaeon]|nr:hypothetical protein [Candidatus Micrarchaeota archaeon]